MRDTRTQMKRSNQAWRDRLTNFEKQIRQLDEANQYPDVAKLRVRVALLSDDLETMRADTILHTQVTTNVLQKLLANVAHFIKAF